jgi:hypothetical protein
MKRIHYATAVLLLLFCAQLKLTELQAQSTTPPAMKASAIQVRMIHSDSDDVKLPADFQVSLYENLIQQLQKQGGFQHVYREGDHNADSATEIVVLHSTVRGFKKGSELLRNVTTVTGKTSVKIHCRFTDKDGKDLLERDLDGKVMFFGANLRATFDFAKKAAKLAHDNFAARPAS